MKIVIFGLTISSSWGNGHATLWRAFSKALIKRGNKVIFFERDLPYYAAHRDLTSIPGGELILYSQWDEIQPLAANHLNDADIGMVTSYCPDGVQASALLLSSKAGARVFYDLDTPITLEKIASGQQVPYLPENGLADFDLVLSYTGGAALAELQTQLGAQRVAPLYGCVDPDVHHACAVDSRYRADFSYLGTFAADRQIALETLFINAALRLPHRRFLLGGAQYPQEFPWAENIYFVHHVPPLEHPAFYCSSTLTLNVTRKAMAQMGYCPSGRLFEAAACGVPILSDYWAGLEQFFEPDSEILLAASTEEAMQGIEMPREQLVKIGRKAQERTLEEHTADRRLEDLERALAELRILSTNAQRIPATISGAQVF